MEIPERLYFECRKDCLVVLDATGAQDYVSSGRLDPWLLLQAGPGNMLETPPKHAVSPKPGILIVECEDGTVQVDLVQGTARKRTPQGEMVYWGSLEDANAGKGYILQA